MAASVRTKAEVLAAIPEKGGLVRHVHAGIPRVGRVQVRHTLRELVAEGRVRFEGPDCARWYLRVER